MQKLNELMNRKQPTQYLEYASAQAKLISIFPFFKTQSILLLSYLQWKAGRSLISINEISVLFTSSRELLPVLTSIVFRAGVHPHSHPLTFVTVLFALGHWPTWMYQRAPSVLYLGWIWSMGDLVGDLRVYQGTDSSSSLPVGRALLDRFLSEVSDCPLYISLNSDHSFINSPFIKLTSLILFEWCHLLPAVILTDTISNQENNEIVSWRDTFCLNSFSYLKVLNSHKFKLRKSKLTRLQ